MARLVDKQRWLDWQIYIYVELARVAKIIDFARFIDRYRDRLLDR